MKLIINFITDANLQAAASVSNSNTSISTNTVNTNANDTTKQRSVLPKTGSVVDINSLLVVECIAGYHIIGKEKK